MIEILLALALSLILTLVISQIYLGSKQSNRLQEAQSRIQENGRFVLALLAKDLRRAGNMGCSSVINKPIVPPNPLATPSPNITPATSLTGYDANANTAISGYPYSASSAYDPVNWLPAAPASLNAVSGTDILSIQFAEPCGGVLQTKVLDTTGTPTLTLPSSNTCSISVATDELVLSDCGCTEVFRADAVAPTSSQNPTSISLTGTTNNSQSHFACTHDVDSEVMLFHSYTYFIRLFNSEPTLYRVENTVPPYTPQPIIEGVEDMQILYGIDRNPVDGSADGSIDQYLKANDVDANGWWANVIAIRVDLVLRSSGVDGANLTTTSAATCNGLSVSDRRLRRCYSFTINFRNPKT